MDRSDMKGLEESGIGRVTTCETQTKRQVAKFTRSCRPQHRRLQVTVFIAYMAPYISDVCQCGTLSHLLQVGIVTGRGWGQGRARDFQPCQNPYVSLGYPGYQTY